MSNSQPSIVKFQILAAVTLVGAATGIAALVPRAQSTTRLQSANLVTQAQANRGEATADYRLAVWLNPASQPARLGLAATQITAGQPAAALNTLKPVGEGSAANRLRIEALIESDQPAAAASTAAHLIAASPTDPNLILSALAYAQNHDQTAAISLVSRATSPEAAGAIRRAASGNLALAAELYANGLLRSSSAMLLTLPSGYERNLLLARIDYTFHDRSNLLAATHLLTSAITINPASLEARQLLIQVDQARGDTAAASQQASLLAKLQSGRP